MKWRVVGVLFLILSFVSCDKSGSLEDEMGVEEAATTTTSTSDSDSTDTDDSSSEEEETSRLKIFPVGSESSQGAAGLNPDDTLNLMAVVIDSTGTVLAEVDASWSVTGDLETSELVPSGGLGVDSKRATFTANTMGYGLIQASLTDDSIIEQYNAVGTVASTGTITVAASLTQDAISVYSGNQLSGTVGTTLGQPIVAKVVNSQNVPVPGAPVTFAVAQGGGSIVTAQPVVTDSSGLATCYVTLGGTTGADGQSFSADISSGTTTSVNFLATGTYASANKVAFTTEPDGMNAGSDFVVQPIVQVQDSYGNLVANDNTTDVTITVTTGAGDLSGITTVTAVNGIAEFTDLDHDTAEDIVLTASATGLNSGDTGTLTVGQIDTDAQCDSEGGNWVTGNGGCENTSYGLVFSKVSTGTYTWYQAVWDVNGTGGIQPSQDADDYGRTHDMYADDANHTDNNIIAYCHSLDESGYTDWRVPSANEYVNVKNDGAATYLKDVGDYVWTSQYYSGGQTYRVRLSPYSLTWSQETVAYKVRCVRSPDPEQLVMHLQPAAATKGFGVNVAFETQPKVKVADDFGAPVGQQDFTVTAAAVHPTGGSLSGTLGGTTSVTTSGGVASFTDLYHSAAEDIKIRFTLSGVGTVDSNTITIEQNYPYALCKTESGSFEDGNGGCKDMGSGLIWSAASSYTMNWHDYVWDETLGANLNSQDDGDNGRTNDYDNDPGTAPDNSGTNYCHDLSESGKEDWRAVTIAEFIDVKTKTPTTYLNFATSTLYQTSHTYSNGYMSYCDLTGICASHPSYDQLKTVEYNAVCVRRDLPASITYTEQPSTSGNFGPNVELDSGIIKVLDIDNILHPEVDGTIDITLSAGANGDLWYSGVNYGNSISFDLEDGEISFSGLIYDGTDTIQLIATSNFTWNGVTYDSFTETSDDLTYTDTYDLARCKAEGGSFQNGNGGCKDMGTGLIWSAASTNTMNWHDYVWDETLGANSNSQDADDNSRTDDYENDPGTAPDNSGTNYCHDLNESGREDWRAVTLNEFIDIKTKTPTTYLNFATNIKYQTSHTYNNGYMSYCNLTDVCASHPSYDQLKTVEYYAVCVRRDPPTSLAFTEQPASDGYVGAGVDFDEGVIQVQDEDGAIQKEVSGTITVSLSDGAAGDLWLDNVNEGDSITLTIEDGEVSLDGISYDGTDETIQLEASASITWQEQNYNAFTVTSSDLVFPEQYFYSDCDDDASGSWASQDGGCKDLVNGYVWSHMVATGTWHQMIWDAAVGGADAADGNDTNDEDSDGNKDDYYDLPGTGTQRDVDATSYCHSLRLNGYDDWYAPPISYFQSSYTAGISSAFKQNTSHHWSATTPQSKLAEAYYMTISSGSVGDTGKTTSTYSIRCVRGVTQP